VTSVTFWDGATFLGYASSAPYGVTWNTLTATPGVHTLTARAGDGLGNSAISAPVTVTVEAASPLLTAAFDPYLAAPVCATSGRACDSGALLNGRAGLGPEPSAPNALFHSCVDGAVGAYHSTESVDRLRVSSLDGTALTAGKPVKVDAQVWVRSYTTDRLDLWFTADALAAPSPTWKLVGTVIPSANGLQTLSRAYTLPTGHLQAIRAMYRAGGSASSPCVAGTYNDVDDLAFFVP
jgi:hypothetical protein